MAINITNADAYFSNHHKTAIWTAFDTDMREVAIQSARRILSRGLGRAMNDNETDYKEGDMSRDEYAVYEQAIHLLEHGRIATEPEAMPYPTAMPESGRPDATEERAPYYNPEALRWLGNYNSVVCMG